MAIQAVQDMDSLSWLGEMAPPFKTRLTIKNWVFLKSSSASESPGTLLKIKVCRKMTRATFQVLIGSGICTENEFWWWLEWKPFLNTPGKVELDWYGIGISETLVREHSKCMLILWLSHIWLFSYSNTVANWLIYEQLKLVSHSSRGLESQS